jgi:branched-chain amino acid transport system ATP-binding protein
MSDLVVEALRVEYGGVVALDDANVRVVAGTIVGLIGPNGAGKTTLINAVTGVVRPSRGTIALGRERLDRLPQYRVARAGVARTYQNIRLFSRLSVFENLRAGAYRKREALSQADAVILLARCGLSGQDLGSTAGTLPYGAQRRLEIARALAGNPALVLLDEPAAGMNPRETHELRAVIRALADSGAGVLLVEHDMSLVSAVCDRVIVLNFGAVIAEGTPASVARDRAVVEAYLGTPT